MKKAKLVFVPSPGAGHLGSTVEAAKLLLNRQDRLSITVLIINPFSDSKVTKYVDSFSNSDRIQLINLVLPNDGAPNSFLLHRIDTYKPQIKEAVSNLTAHSDCSLAGFFLDMFCSGLIDVANEFGVPSYIFFTSGAAFLDFMFHIQFLHDEQQVDPTELKDSDAELVVPSLVNPIPARVLPLAVVTKEFFVNLLAITRKFREAKGIMVNSFSELESYAFDSLFHGHRSSNSNNRKIPLVYPVGPILNLKGDVGSDTGVNDHKEITEWLDDQPKSSVVFLCFGSYGGFGEDQVKEIAFALEETGYRFLWSLRRLPPKDQAMVMPSDYQDPREVLPDGFLDRTAEIGKVIGWAPQATILAHSAIGGFVSHCGWNSILESLWFGVPIATWPMYAEQQFNAFEMVIELGLSVEIKIDYKKNSEIIVNAKDIEKGIKALMEVDSEMRKKVKGISEKSRKVLMDGGSSSFWLDRLIQDVLDNN